MVRLGLKHAPAPPPRRGHYSADGRMWIDEIRRHSYPLGDGADSLEIELQEAGGHSFLGGVLWTLASPTGLIYYRFVGCARSEDPRWPMYAVVGGTFASPRLFLGSDVPPKEQWAPEMTARLKELQDELTEEGWLLAGHGEKPWSARYTRPWVELDR